jgi:MFS transporter (putative signal transducer)
LLVRAFDAWRAVTLAVGLQAAALFALALFAERASLPILAALVGFTFAAMGGGFVAIYSALMALASPKQAGVDFTLFQCADALVAMLGGIAGGWLAQHWGYGPCLATAALLSLAAVIHSLGVHRRFRPPLSASLSP